jgi:hypothetical protein
MAPPEAGPFAISLSDSCCLVDRACRAAAIAGPVFVARHPAAGPACSRRLAAAGPASVDQGRPAAAGRVSDWDLPCSSPFRGREKSFPRIKQRGETERGSGSLQRQTISAQVQRLHAPAAGGTRAVAKGRLPVDGRVQTVTAACALTPPPRSAPCVGLRAASAPAPGTDPYSCAGSWQSLPAALPRRFRRRHRRPRDRDR